MPGNLKNIAVFEGLREEDVRALTDKAVIRNAPKNAIVVNEGDLTDSLYVILSGKVKVYLGDESGKELILDIKGPGQYFGEMVLDAGPALGVGDDDGAIAVRGHLREPTSRTACSSTPRSRCTSSRT